MWEGAKEAGSNKGPAPRGLADPLSSLWPLGLSLSLRPRPRQCPFCLKVLWTRTEGHGRLFEPGSPSDSLSLLSSLLLLQLALQSGAFCCRVFVFSAVFILESQPCSHVANSYTSS